MTPDSSLLCNSISPVPPISIATTNGSHMHVVSASSIFLAASSLSLPNVFYVPHLSLSLSINQLSDSGFDVLFSSFGCFGCFEHVPMESTSTALSSFSLDEKSSPFYLCYSKLGHLSSERLKLLVQSGLLGNISISDIF
ncbi:hypothetical protein RHGRI_020721 [Rhododendron griersonianum]|uniref:Uncharacterized protein n=1 Tax=Rhododendron griersonianum TaxID=479676 RepID=A0AAV6JHL6_9ERIC|nr:hypothetical protein RHGRI_020721 [Rhododendron griersonianum]